MNLNKEDNLYILEEEQFEDDDKSPLNYASYGEESEEEEIEEKEDRKISPFLLMMKILLNPVEGWKKLRRSKIEIEMLQSGCFYPILAILALSNFADYFYSVNVSLTKVVTEAVVAFVAFFFGYFCIPTVLGWFLPKDMVEKFNAPFGRKYLLIALSTLAMFSIFLNLLPMISPILIFLPIWTLYIMFKGIRFFQFPVYREMRFFVISAISVIGVPLLIDWILNSIMPY